MTAGQVRPRAGTYSPVKKKESKKEYRGTALSRFDASNYYETREGDLRVRG